MTFYGIKKVKEIIWEYFCTIQFTWKSFMCWWVCVTMLCIDCGGWEWNTIRNILIAKTDVENRRKLLVFMLREHYHHHPRISSICVRWFCFTSARYAVPRQPTWFLGSSLTNKGNQYRWQKSIHARRNITTFYNPEPISIQDKKYKTNKKWSPLSIFNFTALLNKN